MGPDRFRIQFDASGAFIGTLEEVRALLGPGIASGDLAAIVQRALNLLRETLRAKRFGRPRKKKGSATRSVVATENPGAAAARPDAEEQVIADCAPPAPATREPRPPEPPPPTTAPERRRPVPVAVLREVYERDDARCTFVDDQGRRCTEQRGLQFDHKTPVVARGPNTAQNIRILCKPHHDYVTRLWFGEGFIQQRISERRAIRTAGAGCESPPPPKPAG